VNWVAGLVLIKRKKVSTAKKVKRDERKIRELRRKVRQLRRKAKAPSPHHQRAPKARKVPAPRPRTVAA
jgi:hypothetical protein